MPKVAVEKGLQTAILTVNDTQNNLELFHYKRLPCKYLVGKVRNGKLTLFNTKLVLPLDTHRIDSGIEKTYKNEFNQKRTKLIDKRQKNEIKAELLEEKVEIDEAIGDVPTEIVSHVIVSMNLPCNMDASSVDEIYDSSFYFAHHETIDVRELWKSKDTNSAQTHLQLFNLEPSQSFIYGLVLERLQQKDLFRKEGLRKVLMIQLMIQLFKSSSRKEFKFNRITKNNSIHSVFELFAEKSGMSYKVSSKGRDKILLFIMAQVLLIQQFRFDCDALAKDLSLPLSE